MTPPESAPVTLRPATLPCSECGEIYSYAEGVSDGYEKGEGDMMDRVLAALATMDTVESAVAEITNAKAWTSVQCFRAAIAAIRALIGGTGT